MRSHSLVFDSFWALLYRGFKPQNDWPCNPQNWLVKNTWRWWTYGSSFWVERIPSIAKQWNKLMIVVLDKKKAIQPWSHNLYRCCPDIQLIHQGPKTQLISSLFLGKSWRWGVHHRQQGVWNSALSARKHSGPSQKEFSILTLGFQELC